MGRSETGNAKESGRAVADARMYRSYGGEARRCRIIGRVGIRGQATQDSRTSTTSRNCWHGQPGTQGASCASEGKRSNDHQRDNRRKQCLSRQAVSKPSPAETDWKALARKRLGRLGVFGLDDIWQAALLLPDDWDDLTNVVSNFSEHELRGGRRVVFHGRILGTPKPRFDGAPRLVGYLADGQGRRVGWTIFGDTRELAERLKQAPENQAMLGTLSWFHGWWLRDCEFVPRAWMGKLMPRYPAKRHVIAPETSRERIQALLPDAIPIAADWLADTLGRHGDEPELCRLAGAPGWTIKQILTCAHNPHSIEEGCIAQNAMERLAALGIINRAAETNDHTPSSSWATPRQDPSRIRSMPFTLTTDQVQAVQEIVVDMGRPRVMRRMLTGDVGSGKTAVYGLAAMACLDGGGRVAVLLPNQVLAEQVAREFKSWWPDLNPRVLTGGDRTAINDDTRLLVGTTAILQRAGGLYDLVITDEQHKFSRAQRESWIGNAHLLEVSATCIPRSQALVEFGVLQLSRLHTGHARKQIKTVLWQQHERSALFAGVRATLESGYQVLVIYPRRGDDMELDTSEGDNNLPSVEEAYVQWQRLFPGKVRLAHGGMEEGENQSALGDIRDERAQILVSTTVVEVGLNLPKLRRVVVVHAERFGIVTLHQLRGRVARLGGSGYCDLYLPRPVKDTTIERLNVLVETADGFQVAARDLELRGFGDLGRDSSNQHGADGVFLFGRPVRLSTVEEVLSVGQRNGV